MRQALLISIWQSSAIHLLASSPLKLCQVGWGQTHIFRFLQKYMIEFKLRFWLGYSRTFTALCRSHSCCVLRSTVLLEGKLSAHQRLWMLWTGFSLRLSQYFGALSFSSILMSPSVPAAEKQPYSMRLLPAHFTFGTVLCRWLNMMLRIEVHLTRECFQSCVFTEERIEYGHTAIKPRSVECCSDVCPSVDFSYLHIWSWSSTRVTIRFFVSTLTKALLHQLLSLARKPALRRVLVVSNFFH